jgi:Uma2 family endonuclease
LKRRHVARSVACLSVSLEGAPQRLGHARFRGNAAAAHDGLLVEALLDLLDPGLQRSDMPLQAPFDVILAETTIVQPDIIFVPNDRLGIFSSRGAEGAPTLVIEILSPSTARIDRGTKLQLYARYGVPYYWIVDPGRRAIEVYAWARFGGISGR